MSAATATAYRNSAAGHSVWHTRKCGKAQKQRGFRVSGTYRSCIKDYVLIDPCMGSGHILVAMFDVLMDIYLSAGYDEREATFDIVTYNLYGLDIDIRAYQLAYFAVMMKGMQYNRRFLSGRKDDDGKRDKNKWISSHDHNAVLDVLVRI